MAHETLISRISIPPDNIHRVRGELSPNQAVKEYDAVLAQFFSSPLPRFDLVLLGLGEDGHTASLFPESKALQETGSAVAAVYVEKLNSYRITLTPPAINNSTEIVFLISGEGKAQAVKEVIEGEYRPSLYPAQLIRPASGRLTFMLDRDAARYLEVRG
jgi:6-phosphogluconolactonase